MEKENGLCVIPLKRDFRFATTSCELPLVPWKHTVDTFDASLCQYLGPLFPNLSLTVFHFRDMILRDSRQFRKLFLSHIFLQSWSRQTDSRQFFIRIFGKQITPGDSIWCINKSQWSQGIYCFRFVCQWTNELYFSRALFRVFQQRALPGNLNRKCKKCSLDGQHSSRSPRALLNLSASS